MWLATRGGFLSAVEWQGNKKDKRNGMISVRARERSALEYLVARVDEPVKIVKKGGDYRFRVLLTPDQWVRAAAVLASEIDYGNFKAVVGQEARKGLVSLAYEEALHRVWSIFGSLQPGGPYGKRRWPKLFGGRFTVEAGGAAIPEEIQYLDFGGEALFDDLADGYVDERLREAFADDPDTLAEVQGYYQQRGDKTVFVRGYKQRRGRRR